MHTVFVYGTLRGGEPNHGLLASAEFVGPARTEPGFMLFSCGPYPGMVPGGDAAVAGEVYRVDDRTLLALDELEGYPELYDRRTIRLEGGAPALAYVLSPEQVAGLPLIAGGDWLSVSPHRR